MACLIALVSVAPTLSFSLWGDEQWSWRESIGGRFVRDATSATVVEDHPRLVWEQVGWDQTLWRYLTTNHHFLSAIAGRISNQVWQRATGAPDYAFSETALRVMALAAGLVGIVLWTRLAAGVSALGAAVLAFLLALHPWYLQYLTEARGYPLLFALLPALLLALGAACRAGSRGAWLAVAVLQAAAIYAWPGMVFPLAGLQVAILVSLWRRRRRPGTPAGSVWRWALSNAAAAMIVFQLTAPSLPLVVDYLKQEVPARDVGLHWVTNELSWFALGCDSHDLLDYAQRNPLFHSAEGLLRASPLATSAAIALFGLAFFWGAIVWVRRARLARPVSAGLGASAAAVWLAAWWSGTALYAWYFIYLLPLVLLAVALGIAELAKRCARGLPGAGDRGRAALLAAACTAALAILANVYRHPVAAMRDRSKDPRRESVALTRPPGLPIDHPGQLAIITAHCNQPALAYDPHGWPLVKVNAEPDEPPGLMQLMRLADTVGATLWINVGGVDSLDRLHPEIAEQLAVPELFERVHVVHGLAPQFERHLYRYRGGVFEFLRDL